MKVAAGGEILASRTTNSIRTLDDGKASVVGWFYVGVIPDSADSEKKEGNESKLFESLVHTYPIPLKVISRISIVLGTPCRGRPAIRDFHRRSYRWKLSSR